MLHNMTFMQKNGLMWTCVLDRLLLITMTLFEMLEYYYPLKLIFCYLHLLIFSLNFVKRKGLEKNYTVSIMSVC